MSWNSFVLNSFDHLTNKAAQTYVWNSEKPLVSHYIYNLLIL